MQKNLLLISILILFSHSANCADSLPPLPVSEASSVTTEPASASGNISAWQKIKTFLGMGDKKHPEEVTGKEKPVNQTNLKLDTPAPVNTNQGDISHVSANKNEEDKSLQSVDKKTDISDDFFKNVEKHLQEEDTVITHTPGAAEAGSNNSLNPAAKSDQVPVSAPATSAVSRPENVVNHEPDKNAEAISLPVAIPLPDDEEVAHHGAQSKEEKPKEQKVITQELNPKSSKETKPVTDAKSFAVAKFKEEIKRRNAKKIDELPIIPEKDLAQNVDQSLNNTLVADAKQLKFIADEAKVLIMPNDDVVLGELTESATLELMDFSSYVQMFWQDYERSKRADERQVISDFIDNYDDNFNKVKWPLSSGDPYERLNDAFEIINKQDINKFIAVLNNYSILGGRDKEQNSMLHMAAYAGNYPAAKLLIMKGISLNDVNMEDETPLSIADKYNNTYVAYLLKEAGALSFSKLK
jgi:hypothetical protein